MIRFKRSLRAACERSMQKIGVDSHFYMDRYAQNVYAAWFYDPSDHSFWMAQIANPHEVSLRVYLSKYVCHSTDVLDDQN